jgi:hypothetical protein
LKSFVEAGQESQRQKQEVELSTCEVLVCAWSAEGVEKVARQRWFGVRCLRGGLVSGREYIWKYLPSAYMLFV